MTENSSSVTSGRKVFFVILFLTVAAEIGSFLLGLVRGTLSVGFFVGLLVTAALLLAMWRGKKPARVIMAFFAGITFLFSAYLTAQNRSPWLVGFCLFMLLMFALLVFFGSLGHFMEYQRNRKNQTREDLVKSLLKKRIRETAAVEEWDDFERRTDNLTMEDLYGVPEATIVTIVECYTQYRSRGFSHYEALNELEDFRSEFAKLHPEGSPRNVDEIRSRQWDSETAVRLLREDDHAGSQMDEANPLIPKTLVGYIKYRVALHTANLPGGPIADKLIEDAIRAAVKFFS